MKNAFVFGFSAAAVLSAGAVVLTSQSYVQEGLVAHFDAIENTGAGRVAEPFLGTWSDLKGNAYLTVPSGTEWVDLSGRTGTASAKSNHANGGIANYLTAVAGGTVTVNLAERADLTTLVDSANPYPVTWDGAPVPTAKFVVDAETATQGLAVRVDSTGLRLVRALFMIILR